MSQKNQSAFLIFGFMLVTLVVAVAVGIYEAKQVAHARAEAGALRLRREPLAAQNEQLEQELDLANRRITGLAEEIVKINRNNLELLRLRAEIAGLKSHASPASVPQSPPGVGDGDSIANEMTGIKNAQGVALAGGPVLNFTNGAAIVPGADYPNSPSDCEEYHIGGLMGLDDKHYFCETSVNSGGSGMVVSLGIFAKDDNNAIKSLQMLELGDRVKVYNFEQDGDNMEIFYLDHADNEGMADPPTLPRKTVFALDPATGQYVKGATYGLATDDPWIEVRQNAAQ